MPTELIVPSKTHPARRRGPGRPGSHGPHDGGGRRDAPPSAVPASAASMALAFALTAIAMLFVAFTTTYLGHREDAAWRPIPLPWILWLDTAILIAASVAVEWARRRLRAGDLLGLRRGLTAGAVLGAAFLAGQLAAWRQLADQGIYLSSHPHSSFFYLLTGAHGVHLLGGLAAFAAILPRAWRGEYAPPRAVGIDLISIYWHFLTGLWIYVFILLFWL